MGLEESSHFFFCAYYHYIGRALLIRKIVWCGMCAYIIYDSSVLLKYPF